VDSESTAEVVNRSCITVVSPTPGGNPIK